MKPSLSTRLLGSQCILRPPGTSDIPGFRRLLMNNFEHLRPWSPAAPKGSDPSSFVDLTRAITAQRSAWRDDRSYAFLIEQRGNSALLGRVVLSDVVRGAAQHAALGYWVDHQYQSRGLATEAVNLVLAFAFQTIGLHRIYAAIMPNNLASCRVIQKTGFHAEGLAKGYLQIANTWEDHLMFALTFEEWQERNATITDSQSVATPHM